MSCLHKLYTVTLTDLGTYTATVAAYSEDEAVRIAKTMLHEEATQLPPELSIVKRETTAEADRNPGLNGEASTFKVRATYALDFELDVRAQTPGEAERHARRIYEDNGGPFEFDHTGDRVSEFRAREVQP